MAVGERQVTVCYIQARMTSTRLPGKVMMDIGGESSLARVTRAAESVKGISSVQVLWAHNFPAIDENDVLSRFYHAWVAGGRPDSVMRLTADCPLIDPQVCQMVLASYKSANVSYASNVYPKRTFPDGMDCEVFSGAALAEACLMAQDPYDREHVTTWIQKNAVKYHLVQLPVDWSHWRLTLDTEEDLQWLRTVVEYHK
jgi:spore coat polysaccharide biosynthesis protein SpsF (cytidylyltransferase family)